MGVSIGVERVFSVLEAKLAAGDISVRTSDVDVYVASAQKNFLDERLRICAELWNAGIKVSISLNLGRAKGGSRGGGSWGS